MILIFFETRDSIITTKSGLAPKNAKWELRVEYVDQADFRTDKFSFRVSLSLCIKKYFLQVLESFMMLIVS